MTTDFFHSSLLLLFLDLGSEILDPGWVKTGIRDKHPGSATLLSGIDLHRRAYPYSFLGRKLEG
jgi:hypothetical protein